MRQYKAYIHQEGEGCDYTIGCAQTVIDIHANSIEKAKQMLSQEIRDNYSHEERRLKAAELYEIEQIISIDLADIYTQIDNEEYEKEQKIKEEQERKEFERLKSKFGELPSSKA